jgi:uncharacterized protein (TIGR02271 family)
MISRDAAQRLMGGTAYTADGDKIGSIGQVYLDNDSGEPAWVTVKTGLLGSSESFVPLDQAELTNDGVRVPYDKDRVKGAPNIDTGRELSAEEEERLYSYYGLGAGTAQGYTTDTTTDYDTRPRTEGYDTSGQTTDDAMTRSEERVRTGTESRQAGRARLRKYVVTEQQQVTVPVTREEARVEREPITDENRDSALSGPDITEAEHEVVLTEEQPTVTTETVPVERVRLTKDQVQDEQTVTADVRKEQIDTETDADTRLTDDR